MGEEVGGELQPLMQRTALDALMQDENVRGEAARLGLSLVATHTYRTADLSGGAAVAVFLLNMLAVTLQSDSFLREMDEKEALAKAYAMMGIVAANVSSARGGAWLRHLSTMISVRREEKGEEERRGLLARLFGR